jgi:hypothetical protein
VIGVALLCVAVVAGLSWWRVLLLAAVLTAPFVVAAVVAVAAWRSKGSDDNRSALFCEGVASELRAGATLRHAVSTAAISLGCPPLSVDSPLSESSADLASQFEDVGQELRLIIDAAAKSGSASAAIFEELGSLALAQSEIAHEVRIATAASRATAMVFIGAPLFFALSRLASGEVGVLLASPPQRLVTLLGLGVFLTGLAIAALIAWRARP